MVPGERSGFPSKIRRKEPAHGGTTKRRVIAIRAGAVIRIDVGRDTVPVVGDRLIGAASRPEITGVRR